MTVQNPLHILVVFTGGTISSRKFEGAFKISSAPYQLIEGISGDSFTFETYEPYQIFSENMTPDILLDLFGKISDYLKDKVFDGMIIAHGTDTLAYTAQLANILLSGLGFPVVIMGSKHPLDDLRNDGHPNFLNSLTLFTQVHSGVYVVSRTNDGTDYIHDAGTVMQADSQTDDFQSYRQQIFGVIKDGVLKENPAFRRHVPSFDSRELLSQISVTRENSSDMTVLALDACVGMNYQTIDLTRTEYKYVLQRLYHSGTACTAPRESHYSLLFLQDLCKKSIKRLFIAPIESARTPYSTTCELLEAGITPVYDRPFESVWAGLLVCTWLHLDPDRFFQE